jgi:S-formylglutathione hydrolase FrmB
VILPEDYDDPAAQERRYPVVYLLHGIGGHEDEWLDGSKLADYAAGRGVIVLCADAAQRCYVDSVNGDSLCETMGARDLVAFADRTFRTIPQREARGLMGLSMGGYGALYLSLRHPSTFAAAVSLSGAFVIGLVRLGERNPNRAHVDRLFPASLSGREQYDLFAQVRIAPREVREGLRWKVLCGAEDRLIDINRAFHHYLLAMGVAHEYDEYPGAHTWPFWDAHATESLDFLAKHLMPASP